MTSNSRLWRSRNAYLSLSPSLPLCHCHSRSLPLSHSSLVNCVACLSLSRCLFAVVTLSPPPHASLVTCVASLSLSLPFCHSLSPPFSPSLFLCYLCCMSLSRVASLSLSRSLCLPPSLFLGYSCCMHVSLFRWLSVIVTVSDSLCLSLTLPWLLVLHLSLSLSL